MLYTPFPAFFDLCILVLWTNIYFILQFAILLTCGYFVVTGKVEYSVIIMLDMYLWRVDNVVESNVDDLAWFTQQEKNALGAKMQDWVTTVKDNLDKRINNPLPLVSILLT